MFIDLVIRESALSDLLAAALSRMESIPIGAGQSATIRAICDWHPADADTLQNSIARVNLDPQFRIGATRFDPRFAPRPIDIPNGRSRSLRVRSSETALFASLGISVVPTAMLTALGLSRGEYVVSWPFKFKLLVTGLRESVIGMPTVRLSVSMVSTEGVDVPQAVLDALAVGVHIPIPLAELESNLGGVRFVSANVMSYVRDADQQNGLLVIRLLFIPNERFTPPVEEQAALLDQLENEFTTLGTRSQSHYVAVLGGDRMAFCLADADLTHVLRSAIDTKLRASGAARLETPEVLVVTNPGGSGVDLFSRMNIRLVGGCLAHGDELANVRTDLVATVTPNLRIEVIGRELVLRGIADAAVHYGWGIVCAFAQIGFLWRVPIVGWAGTIVGIVTVVPFLVFAGIISAIRPSSQEIARYSNGFFQYDEASKELVARIRSR